MEEKPTHSEIRRILRVWMSRKIVAAGTAVILILIFTAIFAPWLAPYDPYKPDLRETLRPPSWTHPLGTDALGRDLLSRIIYGSRTSLQVGLIAVGLAAVTGMFLGLLAGYFGGWTERIIMRFIDAQMAFPPIVLALSLAFVLGGGLFNCMVAVGVAMTPSYVRLTRGQVLTIKEMDYIIAARIIGGSNRRILFNHILHNVFPPLMVLMTINLGSAILAEASLSFLGVGIKPPAAAWGSMLQEGYQNIFLHPFMSFAPGFCILLIVLSFNLMGDGLRDALDPRLRGVI
ncbi:MAG: ABC transporter permease [Deltaproteobacteria bacterium]|nr:MAG: ABC transporter permease [Deltaproteobacteria bacterium]